MKAPDPQQRLIELLTEVVAVAKVLTGNSQPPRATSRHTGESGARGVYPHQSKYNPWRAYVWDTRLHKQVYIGAFPSVAKARAAQKNYRAGTPVTDGTKAALRVVGGAR